MRVNLVSADDAREPGDLYCGEPAEVAVLAIDRAVLLHSIIGDRGLGDGIQSSDGVVPYISAHLKGVETAFSA
jgi:hypothetical protein